VAGLLLASNGVDVAYWTNAVTFLLSAALVSRIPAAALRSEERITKGHWRELREGLRLVVSSRPLVTVLVVWGTAAVATACINVAEVIFARHDLGAGNMGLGLLVSATGVGLVIGSFYAASALRAFGVHRVYPGALALMAAGFGLASASPTIVLAALLAAVATLGNGAAIVCNQVLVQRGAPDAMRGRALAVLMSTYYAILGISMAGGGLLVDSVGARSSWAIASCIFLAAAVLAVALTARLGERAVPAAAPSGLDRIKVLMDEIEETRQREQRATAEIAVLTPRDAESGATR
jgi:MFS family permease